MGGKTDALGFATGKGVCGAIQGQVGKTDIEKELKAVFDFVKDLIGDFLFARAKFEAIK